MQRSRLAGAATELNHGGVWLHIDGSLLDFHVSVEPGHKKDDLQFVLDFAERWGLSLLDQDECEPEILDDGRIRLYLKATA
ncbi:hypothetical protein ACGF07_00470 [Kitasatospora sp. NPDC048194]|uniref:hypothetical protein n=1 Tax=Kitasatospora sp. NPDC048194 TaxID=3364045 RepID=UPI0037149C36